MKIISMKYIHTLLLQLYRNTTLRLILLTFIVYNANLRSITSFDTNPTRYLPISILKEFDLDLDEFPFLHKYPEQKLHQKLKHEQDIKENEFPRYLRYVRDHYMSAYPVMPAILSIPVYTVPVFLGLTEGAVSSMGFTQTEIVGTLLSKISGSLVVSISVGILYLTLLRLTNKRSALWIALIYGLATSSWAVSSQGLWQSSMSQPCLAFAFYFFIKAKENTRNIIYAGIPLALSVACRPHNTIFVLIMFVYVIHKHRAQIIHFMAYPAIIATILLTYNIYYFSTPVGGYGTTTESSKILTSKEIDEKETLTKNNEIKVVSDASRLSYPRLNRLLGLLVSPSRGLLVYSPCLIFAFIGMVLALYHRNLLLTYVAIATIMTIISYSSFYGWHGAFGYSYRMLVDLLPGLCLFLAVVYDWIVKHRWVKSLFVFLVFFSIFIQIIGTFFYPCGFYDEASKSDIRSDRIFWNWKDAEFVRCLRTGPVEPEGLTFIKSIITKR